MADEKRTQDIPHLQIDKPKYQQKIDEVNAQIKGNPPAIMELLVHIMEEQHEIKLMLKRVLGPSN